jgi:glycosyltransferase involved in cell wall biosynthesis
MPAVDILLPTYNRRESLIMTLAGIAAQTLTDARVIVADQSDEPAGDSQVVQTLRRVIEARGRAVEWHERPQIHGIAEQRDFLLRRATADAVLYLDDDVLMEPWVEGRLLDVLRREGCGFVGAFPAGLSHRDDARPEQQALDVWDGPVRPEVVVPGSREWGRWQLHRAANVYHAAQRLGPGETLRYKVAWVASCVLYDRRKLLEVGGFGFWERLPRWHSGEEVLVQNLLMRRWGGCAILPSGAYYSEVETTVLNDAGTVDGHALALLPELVRRYAPDTASGMPSSTNL